MDEEKTAAQGGTVMFKLSLSVLATAVFVLVALIVVMAERTVFLEADGERVELRTFATTVGDVLQRQGVVLLEKDQVTPSPETRLSRKTEISVIRANDLTILADGREIPARTLATRVSDALKEYQIALDPWDEVQPDLESPIEPGMTVSVARIRVENYTSETPIEYGVQREYTVNMPIGSSRVSREGKEGKELQTWQVTFRDGVEVLRTLVSKEVLAKPVDQVLLCGSATSVSRGGDNIRFSRSISMSATAYTHTGRNTASGVPPYRGAVAVDTSVIPFGTNLYIDGYGYAKALDRGSAIKGNKIDVFFETYEETVAWGKRQVDVYILD